MKRRHVSGHKYRKSFGKKRSRGRAINSSQVVMRGGIRL